MVNLMDGERIFIQMVDIIKDLLLMVFHMDQVDLLWKMGIFIKEKLSLVELMEMDIF
jgi:hypothetical protein